MQRWIGKLSEKFYALMRVIFGLLYACHGGQKILAMFYEGSMEPSPLLVAAGVIELAGGILIAVGLFAQYAAFIASGEMAVAYFMMHAPRGFWPIKNGGELAVLFCFAFLYITAKGPGPFALKK